MRECPKCGYFDPPIWRHKRHRIATDYCHISDLELWKPELAETIKKFKDIKIGHYIYHLTKAGYVDRIHESDSKDGLSWREPDQEKGKTYKYNAPAQTKLQVA